MTPSRATGLPGDRLPNGYLYPGWLGPGEGPWTTTSTCIFLIHIRPLYGSHGDELEWTQEPAEAGQFVPVSHYYMERRHRINGENTPKHQPEIPETTDGILDLLSLAPYGAYAVDISQIIVFWNRSAERILGHKADRIIGHRCYEVLQHLPGEGSTPICMEGCPSIRLAREGRIPPVVRVRARCVSGLRKEITVTPLIVPAAQEDRTLLLHLFNENLDEAWATRAVLL